MAVFRTSLEKEDDPKICPRCKGELLTIDGNLVKWLTCTNCKWKKLVHKEEKVIKIVPMRESHEELKTKESQKLKVSFG